MNVYCKRILKTVAGIFAVAALICVHVGNHGNLTPLMMENIEALTSSSGSGSTSSSGTGTTDVVNVICYDVGSIDCPLAPIKVREVVTERMPLSLKKGK